MYNDNSFIEPVSLKTIVKNTSSDGNLDLSIWGILY